MKRRGEGRRVGRFLRGWSVLAAGHRPTERLATMTLLVIVMSAMFVAEAGPRWLREHEESSLEEAIAAAPGAARQLTIRVLEDAPAGDVDDPLRLQYRQLDGVVASLPPDLTERFVDDRIVVDTQRFVVADEVDRTGVASPPASPTFLTFRVHPELTGRSRLVDGRQARPDRRDPDGRPVFEFELTPESAETLGWSLGQTMRLTVDPSDPVTRAAGRSIPDDFIAELVGLRALDPEVDPYWAGDARLHRPTVADTALGADLFAFAIIHPQQLPGRPFLVDRRGVLAIEHRSDLDPSSVRLDDSPVVLQELANVSARFGEQPTLSRPGVRTGLGAVLESEASQRVAARQAVVVAGVTALGVVGVLSLMVMLAVVDRRRSFRVTARARGATTWQVVGASLLEIGPLLAVGHLIGSRVAAWAVPTPAGSLGSIVSAGLALVTLVAAASVAWLSDERRTRVVAGRAVRIAGVVLVCATVAALVTLRRSGVGSEPTSTDVLIVVVPLLVGGSVALASRWLVPRLAARAARVAGGRSGPGSLIGFRRATTAGAGSVGLVILVVLASMVWALGSAMERAIRSGAVDASWVEVGAPFRLDSGSPALLAELRAVPGVVVAAQGRSRTVVSLDGTTATVTVTALDISESNAITSGTAAEGRWPDALVDGPVMATTASTRTDVVPVVATRRLGGRSIAPGTQVRSLPEGGPVFEVVEVRSEVAGRSEDSLVVDRTRLGRARSAPVGFDTLRIAGASIDGDDALGPVLRSAELEAGAPLVTRDEVERALLGDPLVLAVLRAFRFAAITAGVAVAGGLLAVGVVSARARQDQIAVLLLLGARRSTLRTAIVAEFLPPLTVAVLSGALSGWLVVRAFAGRVDLSAFVGEVDVAISWTIGSIAPTTALLAVIAAATTAVSARRLEAGVGADLVRFGDTR